MKIVGVRQLQPVDVTRRCRAALPEQMVVEALRAVRNALARWVAEQLPFAAV